MISVDRLPRDIRQTLDLPCYIWWVSSTDGSPMHGINNGEAYTKRVSLWMSTRLREGLDTAAEANDRTAADEVRDALRKHIDDPVVEAPDFPTGGGGKILCVVLPPSTDEDIQRLMQSTGRSRSAEARVAIIRHLTEGAEPWVAPENPQLSLTVG